MRISRAKGGAAFDRQRGQVSILDQIPLDCVYRTNSAKGVQGSVQGSPQNFLLR
jgi:hypothetical protein